jgi:hypothetical protein
MTNAEMVTTFKIRTDVFETPVGCFDYHADAAKACERVDMLPDLCISHRVEMAKVRDLLKALNEHVAPDHRGFATPIKDQAEEYSFTPLQCPTADLSALVWIPEKYWHLVAFAVEGNSEGYYVHVGAILRGEYNKATEYIEFGLAKTYSPESAYQIAKEASRFLVAAQWN